MPSRSSLTLSSTSPDYTTDEMQPLTSPDYTTDEMQPLTSNFTRNVETLQAWLTTLDDTERAAVLGSIAQTITRNEIPPLVEVLESRLRKLQRRKLERIELQSERPRPPLPVFPHDTSDPRWLYRWLRSLRLHKYEKCLSGLRPSDLLHITEGDLERLGVDTVGARNKLLRVLEIGKRDTQRQRGNSDRV